jgi:hypothetical protein
MVPEKYTTAIGRKIRPTENNVPHTYVVAAFAKTTLI